MFFAFILSLRGIVTIEYAEELALSVRVLFIKINILPKKEGGKRVRSMSRKKSDRIERRLKQKADKKRLKKEEKREKKKAEEKEKKKPTLAGILDTVNLATTVAKAALGSFFGHLRVNVARFKIRIATGDAASTAIAYGAVSQTVAYLLAIFENNKRVKGIKKADMDIACDFLGESSSADIKISFSLRVWHLFHLAFSSLISFIKHKINAQKKTGGATLKNGK